MAFIGTLASAAGNGNTPAITAKGGWLYSARIGGTFDSATVKIQIYDDDLAEWIQVGSDITSASVQNIEMASGTQVRLNVAGGGGSVSINGRLKLLRNR